MVLWHALGSGVKVPKVVLLIPSIPTPQRHTTHVPAFKPDAHHHQTSSRVATCHCRVFNVVIWHGRGKCRKCQNWCSHTKYTNPKAQRHTHPGTQDRRALLPNVVPRRYVAMPCAAVVVHYSYARCRCQNSASHTKYTNPTSPHPSPTITYPHNHYTLSPSPTTNNLTNH